MRHSELVNITDHSFSHTKTDNYIEYNIFINTAGFRMYDWWDVSGVPADAAGRIHPEEAVSAL